MLQKHKKIFGLLLILFCIVLSYDIAYAAKKDTKKPTITLSVDTMELTNSDVHITVSAKDASGIKEVKYTNTYQKKKYFKNNGEKLKLNSENKVTIRVKENSTYTFYAIDKAGNTKIKRIQIKNIDKVAPEITVIPSTITPTNQTVTLSYTIIDESPIENVMVLKGVRKYEDFFSTTDVPSYLGVNNKNVANYMVNENGEYTVLVHDQAGNYQLNTYAVKNIDKIAPNFTLDYSVMNQQATIVIESDATDIAKIQYVKGEVTSPTAKKWTTSGKDITGSNKFTVKSSGNYSVMMTDLAGNQAIQSIYVELELRAVWISYLEYLDHLQTGYTEERFRSMIQTMFNNVIDLNMNAVIVQVRPFGDAMYSSKYFPWSRYVSGKQGVNPGFDPLAIMVEEAHIRDLEIHAWINPYRVTTSSTNVSVLSDDNPAKKWLTDKDKTNDRNVLSFAGNLYYNPASSEVQKLIINGIKEIVTNYEVDGIHFDDYFYPSLGSSYKTTFDSVEYEAYKEEKIAADESYLSIADWRRNNVNTLVKTAYSEIKKINEDVRFGISPGGFAKTLLSDTAYYVDFKTWLSTPGYIDYICPQVYWTFENATYPFKETVDLWLSYRTIDTVNMYIGIANYRAGSTLEPGWKDPNILKDMILAARDTGEVDGFMFFRYSFFYNKVCLPAVEELMTVLD